MVLAGLSVVTFSREFEIDLSTNREPALDLASDLRSPSSASFLCGPKQESSEQPLSWVLRDARDLERSRVISRGGTSGRLIRGDDFFMLALSCRSLEFMGSNSYSRPREPWFCLKMDVGADVLSCRASEVVVAGRDWITTGRLPGVMECRARVNDRSTERDDSPLSASALRAVGCLFSSDLVSCAHGSPKRSTIHPYVEVRLHQLRSCPRRQDA